MTRITTPEQLAEALADGLRLEDANQHGRGLSETEALELIGAGAKLIILGDAEHREVPRKHGRSGALNDLAAFGALVAPLLTHLDRPGWALEVVDPFAVGPLPINADRPLYAFHGTPDATRPGELIDLKTMFDSPKCSSHSTPKWSHYRPMVDAQAWGASQLVEQNHRAIRLALIPPSRS